ncbi:MAG: class I SAM-dependent methyltransferase [Enhydrobacter sp.]|nr:class I SAM-dependent methyltransferase [Enhydrobacter sp.]
MRFAARGARWTCADIVADNLALIGGVAALKGLGGRIETHLIDDDLSFAGLAHGYDVIWVFGSIHHVPFETTRREALAALALMKPGGRWMELVYPRKRWLREGALPFAEWGRLTDGERTPWAVWHDMEKVRRRWRPPALSPCSISLSAPTTTAGSICVIQHLARTPYRRLRSTFSRSGGCSSRAGVGGVCRRTAGRLSARRAPFPIQPRSTFVRISLALARRPSSRSIWKCASDEGPSASAWRTRPARISLPPRRWYGPVSIGSRSRCAPPARQPRGALGHPAWCILIVLAAEPQGGTTRLPGVA